MSFYFEILIGLSMFLIGLFIGQFIEFVRRLYVRNYSKRDPKLVDLFLDKSITDDEFIRKSYTIVKKP